MATMKDIIQSPLLLALGLFASSASGSKVVKGGIKGVLPVLIIMTVLSLAARLAGYGSVLGGLVGIFIIVMLPIGILTSYVKSRSKGKQKNSRTDVREFFVAYSAFFVLLEHIQLGHQLGAHNGEDLLQLAAVLRGEALSCAPTTVCR